MDWRYLDWYPCQSIHWSVTISGSAEIETDHKCPVQFDTEHPDIFISSPSCPTCSEHKLYDPSLSSTSVDKNTQVTSVRFGPGTVDGGVVSDVIFIGGGMVSHGTYPLKERGKLNRLIGYYADDLGQKDRRLLPTPRLPGGRHYWFGI